MKYSLGTIAKALVAAAVTGVSTAAGLAGGADLSALDLGQLMAVVGAALTAASAVFVTPNKGSAQPPADAAINAIQETVQNVTHAASELDRVREVATNVLNQVPVLGPLAKAAINSLPRF